ncbi:SPOR domain-containing protein [Altererythrobacter sp. ZODW24]|uniref:SPOR domain-containing protein n=1 Tax=Altererythrobacter sp. ZODW24 TaxID=2185142 RepID=UPI000DF7F2AA|nr:SPOR domain-containing protein [Altererythrobacter sp. ZODW24]
MTQTAKTTRMMSLALTTALATTALGGCTTNAAPPSAVSASKAENALAKGKTSKAIQHAEAAVLAEPRNAALRAMLGATYLEAGRFQSAATSFDDAMSLGDNSPRTALSLALAQAASGDYKSAQSVLTDWQDDIAAADLGLAFALAGQPDRGVHILSNTLRAGENTAKVRQNLAYAYALQGNWRAARVMAAEDIPAGQINDRISHWAQMAQPENFQRRVADLLSVPVTADSGQPLMLALSNSPTGEQLASEAAAYEAPVVAEAAPVASGNYALASVPGELPALGDAAAFPPPPAPAPAPMPVAAEAPVVALKEYPAKPVARPDNFQAAFDTSAPAGASPAEVMMDTVRFATSPVVQSAPARMTAAPKASESRSAQAPAKSASGDHLVQLGSFSSERGAKRAWGIYAKRYPQLSQHDMVITKAMVRGKTYWRVSAAGFGKKAANNMCSTVKGAGQGCFAWAKDRPMPGAIDTGIRVASR